MANTHIHQRKDGNYYFKLHGHTYVRAKRKDAEALYRELVENYKFQLATKDLRKVTIQMLLEKWIASERGKVKRTTYDRKEQIVNHQLIPYLGKQQVATLTKEDVQGLLNKLCDLGYSHSTIKKTKEYLHQALVDTEVLEKIPNDPFFKVVVPEEAKRKTADDIVYYTETELEKIYDAATSKHTVKGKSKNIYRLGDFVVVLGHTGMRSGEFLALQWTDIDFTNKLINIDKTREVVKNRDPKISSKTVEIVTKPKTKSSIRKIPMSADCERALRNLYDITGMHDNVLSTEKGTPITTRNFARTFKQILVRAEMDSVTVSGKIVNKVYGLHSMRHSFATLMINKKGANISAVSKILGHADVSVTINRYVHTDEKDKRTAIDLLDK